MFTKLSLKNFKCFKDEMTFHLSKVNVFTGYNGRGKSSVFQSLLLLAQSLYDNRDMKYLIVNSIFCKLGLFEDLIPFGSKDNILQIGIETSNPEKLRSVIFKYSEYSDRKGKWVDIIVDGKSSLEVAQDLGGNKTSSQLPLRYPEEVEQLFRDFYYVSADRLGPTPFEVKQDLYENNPVGNSGEFRLNVIASDMDLKNELAAAIGRIMSGGKLDISGDSDAEKTEEVLRLYFTTLDGHYNIKAINCGFGYSYIVPILLAAMNMKSGCLFVENPEAHLHPLAQSQLIKELVKICCKKDVQLFVETHSEHVVNALRLCALYDGEYSIFSNDDISMYFFDADMEIKHLTIDEHGQMSEWPLGFFDQAERDVAEIIRLGLR